MWRFIVSTRVLTQTLLINSSQHHVGLVLVLVNTEFNVDISVFIQSILMKYLVNEQNILKCNCTVFSMRYLLVFSVHFYNVSH